jgi:hypothetical protein
MHRSGPTALDARHLLGVEAELKDVRGLGAPRELGVDHLVAAVRLALEKVGQTAPRALGERGLVDHRRACADGRLGLGHRPRPVELVRVVDAHDLVAQRGQVPRLVLVALAADQLGVRVVAERPLELLARHRELERRQVRAGEEADQVGRREAEAATLGAHSSIVAPGVAVLTGVRPPPRTSRATG